MTPQEFMEHWGLTVPEMAQLTGKSRETVYQWLSLSENRVKQRDAPIDVIRQLEMINAIWKMFDDLETTIPPYIHQMYEQVKDRKDRKPTD